MNRFVATLNGGETINIPAERMELKENFIYVWRGDRLVAMVDISAVVCAYISERGSA